MTARKPLVLVSGVWRELPSGDSVAATDVPGAVPYTLYDAKGDLLVGTGSDTAARRAVGGNNSVLTADSAQSDGVKWSSGCLSLDDPLAQSLLYGDIMSTGARHLAGTAFAMSASFRTIQFLAGWIPSGTVVSGFRTMRSVAQATGTMQVALYGDVSKTSTSWTRLAANFSGLFNATGVVDTSYSFTAANDMYIRCQMTLTAVPGTYPTLLWLPPGGSSVPNSALRLASSTHPIQIATNATTAPAATLDPSSTTGEGNLIPWFSLF